MAADRFTRLEKIAVFLIAIGEEQTRRFLADLDLATVEQVNEAIAGLGGVAPSEKAAIMIEFAEFFYRDKPLEQKKRSAGRRPAAGGTKRQRPSRGANPRRPTGPAAKGPGPADTTPPPTPKARPADRQEEPAPPAEAAAADGDEDAILDTLEKLRQRVDPQKIDWGRAGYDFGEGFKGPDSERP